MIPIQSGMTSAAVLGLQTRGEDRGRYKETDTKRATQKERIGLLIQMLEFSFGVVFMGCLTG